MARPRTVSYADRAETECNRTSGARIPGAQARNAAPSRTGSSAPLSRHASSTRWSAGWNTPYFLMTFMISELSAVGRQPKANTSRILGLEDPVVNLPAVTSVTATRKPTPSRPVRQSEIHDLKWDGWYLAASGRARPVPRSLFPWIPLCLPCSMPVWRKEAGVECLRLSLRPLACAEGLSGFWGSREPSFDYASQTAIRQHHQYHPETGMEPPRMPNPERIDRRRHEALP